MTKDEALRLALDALEYEAQKGNDNAYQSEREAIKAALEAKDEPVACKECHLKDTVYDLLGDLKVANLKLSFRGKRTWVGLTDEEIEVIEVLRAPPVHPDFVDCDDWVEFARAIEAKLKEKNHG